MGLKLPALSNTDVHLIRPSPVTAFSPRIFLGPQALFIIIPSSSARAISHSWAGISSLFSRQKSCTFAAPVLLAVRATSMATLPPPITITSPLKSNVLPRPTSRKKSQPHRTPFFSEPSREILVLPLAPLAIKIALKSFLSWSMVISFPMVVFPLKVTPHSRISSMSLSSLSSGNL